MPLWALLVWLVIGAAAGFLAPRIMGGPSGLGQMGDLVLGLIGALAAGYGLALSGIGLSGMNIIIATFVAALVGALGLIWVGRMLKGAMRGWPHDCATNRQGQETA